LNELVRLADNPNIARFMTDGFASPFTPEHALAFIQRARSMAPARILAIEADCQLAGGIGIHPQDDIHCLNAELGYWIGEPFWGQGIATEAIIQMVGYAFTTFEIQRVFARPFGNNFASQRVLQKVGFTLEATLQNTLLKEGQLLDELIYAVRREV